MASKTYYTLAVFHKFKNGMRWTAEFGDYDRRVVAQELEDTRDDWPRGSKFKIIKTDHEQSRIDAAISELNMHIGTTSKIIAADDALKANAK